MTWKGTNALSEHHVHVVAGLLRMDIRKKERALEKFAPREGQDPEEAARIKADFEHSIAVRREALDILRGPAVWTASEEQKADLAARIHQFLDGLDRLTVQTGLVASGGHVLDTRMSHESFPVVAWNLSYVAYDKANPAPSASNYHDADSIVPLDK